MKVTKSVAVILAFSVCVTARAASLDVYILTGQSNSLGTTSLEGAGFDPGAHAADAQTDFFWSNVSTASSDPNIIVLYGNSAGAITTLQMQQGDGGANINFWGPEFGLARTMFNAGNSNVMVIKASRGGGGNSFWLPTTGHMYNHLLAQVDVALTAAQTAGNTVNVKGFIYLQGESNNATEAAAASPRLQTLIDGVRSHINANFSNAAAGMYSVVGEIAASSSNADRITTTSQQKSLAAGSATIGFITTNDLPLKSDGLHFGRDAKLEIGRRFADAFHSQAWVENPSLFAGYSANQGSVNAIPNPIAQGLSALGSSTPGVALQAINDNGTPAWQVSNNSRTASPSYQQALDGSDFQAMLNQGWSFKAKFKVVSGGGQALWSLTQGNDPGWGFTSARNSNGFEVSRVNGNELQVALWQNQSSINLGPGSADQYHTVELCGMAGLNSFDFYIDGLLRSTGNSLLNGNGLAGFDNTLTFNSGAGLGRVVNWNEVSLTAIPEPASFLLIALGGGVFVLARRNGR